MRELLGLDLARAHLDRGGELVLSYSGGKDSNATAMLLRRAGLPFRAVFADTGWEHPEAYRYIREVAPDILGQRVIEVRAEVNLIASANAYADRIEKRGGRSMSVEDANALASVIRSEGVRKDAYAQAFEAELGHYSAMLRTCLHKIMFPAQSLRWCTEELKIWPIATWLDQNCDDPWIVQGIRKEESRARSTMTLRETMKVRGVDIDQEIFRPLLDHTEDDVIALHREMNTAPCAIYLWGASRLGCWPCIYARKDEIARLEAFRIDFLARLEGVIKELFAARLDRTSGEGRDQAWFQMVEKVWQEPTGTTDPKPVQMVGEKTADFLKRRKAWELLAIGGYVDKHVCVPINEVYQWSKTKHGGRQFQLFAPDDGCMKWGFCEHKNPPPLATQ